MLWKAPPIPISEAMYQTSGPAMYVLRCLGLFPMTIERNGAKLLLKWSPLYAFLSYIFGILTLIFTYIGYLGDVYVGRDKSVRMKTETDVYVQFTDITAVTIVHFFGIFVTPFRFSTFSRYIRCLHEVDAIIPPVNLKSDRNLSIFMMASILIGIFTILTIDMLMFIRISRNRQPAVFVLQSYIPFYVAYHVMYGHQFLFWHLVYCIYKRIKLLNKHLKNTNLTYLLDSKLMLKKGNNEGIIALCNTNEKRALDDSCSITKIITAYGKLCDASSYLSRLLGINTAITLVGVLWHLIVLPYFLITSISRDNKDITFTLMQVVWITLTVARLMLIAQPCYTCLLEVQNTKDRVSRLISTPDINDNLRTQLQTFSTVLQLRKFEFSTSGLALVDRYLVTSILGTVTTYLVVLLQVADSKTQD